MSNRISGLLLLILIALCAVIVIELTRGVPSAEDLRTLPGKERGAAAAGPVQLTVPPLAALSETVARPLFSATRRPPEEEAGDAPDAPVSVPVGPATNFSVTAIVISEKQRAVLLTHPQSGELERVAEGESIAGWRVDKVESDRVFFSKNGETLESALRTFGPPAPRRPQRGSPTLPGVDTRDRRLRQNLNNDRLRPLISREEPASER